MIKQFAQSYLGQLSEIKNMNQRIQKVLMKRRKKIKNKYFKINKI